MKKRAVVVARVFEMIKITSLMHPNSFTQSLVGIISCVILYLERKPIGLSLLLELAFDVLVEPQTMGY